MSERIGRPTVPTVYNITMTLVDTQYSQQLPDEIARLEFWVRDGTAMRFAFVTGKVAAPTAPYATLPANGVYWQDFPGTGTLLTLYVACASAGKIVEVIAWV